MKFYAVLYTFVLDDTIKMKKTRETVFCRISKFENKCV